MDWRYSPFRSCRHCCPCLRCYGLRQRCCGDSQCRCWRSGWWSSTISSPNILIVLSKRGANAGELAEMRQSDPAILEPLEHVRCGECSQLDLALRRVGIVSGQRPIHVAGMNHQLRGSRSQGVERVKERTVKIGCAEQCPANEMMRRPHLPATRIADARERRDETAID